MQRVTPGVGESFGPVEEALKETFIPEFFEGLREGVPERGVTRLPVRQAGLDGVLCYHRTLSRGTQGPGGFPDGGPLGLPPGESDGSEETRTDSSGGGSDGHTVGGPGLTRTSPATSNKDRGLAYSAAVHIQWHGAGGPGMA